MRILVVEDSATVRIALRSALRNLEGVPPEVTEAPDAPTARALFDDVDPEVVFLDMVLGNERGVDLLHWFLERRPAVCVILLTGLEREHPDVQLAISDGAFGYVRKPVRRDAVRNVLATRENESGALGRII